MKYFKQTAVTGFKKCCTNAFKIMEQKVQLPLRLLSPQPHPDIRPALTRNQQLELSQKIGSDSVNKLTINASSHLQEYIQY